MTVSVRETATDVLRNVWADDDALVSLPIDPVEIANRLGYPVYEGAFTDNRAARLVNGRIEVNRKSNVELQRIAVARQLGEALATGGRTDYAVPAGDGLFFANDLILPAVLVRKYWGMNYTLRRMAKLFGVSDTVMEARIITLELL